MKDGSEVKPEILIIRRGGGDDNAAHKGGAWKIAYADFVTAMMAFFLVMWLINSANEVTKARVASYFNPIKMTDASPSKRGLKEPVNSQDPKSNIEADGSVKVEAAEKGGNKEKKVTESAMLSNPFSYLDELVKHGVQNEIGSPQPGNSESTGDPFDPRSYELLDLKSNANKSEGKPYQDGKKSATEPEEVTGESEEQVESGETEEKPKAAAEAEEQAETAGEKKAEPAKKADDGTLPEETRGTDEEVAAALEKAINETVQKFEGKVGFKFNVKVTEEGVLVTLEDGKGQSMFAIGSAEPNPVLVHVIGKIGEILGTQTGKVVVRGHTDGRRYRSGTYDNWQLSTQRAHMASYMLMRGGLPEDRIWRIEGHGASALINRENPFAEENRRVEFLLAH